MKILETERLILRTWEKSDIEPYLAFNNDPKVLELLLGPLTREQVETFFEKSNAGFLKDGYMLFAVEEKTSGELIGYVGLCNVPWDAHFTPAVEIGWRLGSQYWGKGYATDAAREVLRYAFEELQLDEVVSFTSPLNVRSIRVMEKIGLKRDRDGDFLWPRVPADHKLSPCVLYRLKRGDYVI
ncbi:MAG: hypothetical protein QG604_995 [Candidatus Dependentiae bacterium]|nr:hypothetical protein [Candidatus Dependentiae bacterium]